MKITKRLFNGSLVVLTALFLSTPSLLSAAEKNLKVNKTTVGGPGSAKLCIRDYGKTPEEAFALGNEILQKADASLGTDKLHGNVRIRILPEKENGMFVVEVYFYPDTGSCPVKPEYRTAQVLQQ
ncbi:hypothetical protein [Candidatus Electrothrix sp.]|uniref:hypothetical protein n=1 Tax=Candidatus Electrothrix sp. TaxID=2170559 RepID=UPI00405708AD